MSDDLTRAIQHIIDTTGLDRVTALKIASAHAAPPRDQAIPPITSAIAGAALAPPTTNEPAEPPPAAPGCPDCGGAGWYKEAVPYGHPRFGQLLPCACKQGEQETRAAIRRTAILSGLAHELGDDLARCRLASYVTTHPDPTQRQALSRALRIATDYSRELRGWFYLWGPCGTGKSHLAAAVAHEAALRGLHSSYASVPALLRFLKAGFGDGTGDARMVALQLVDLLVLDDIGAEYHKGPGDWADGALFELINQRYLYNKATIFTSNMPPSEIEPRIASRIVGRAREVRLFVDDYRRRQAPQGDE